MYIIEMNIFIVLDALYAPGAHGPLPPVVPSAPLLRSRGLSGLS